jgi:hypothetical protein
MRKLFTTLVAILLTASIFAQAPQKISYQAVIRNSANALVTNTQIGMEINIRQGLQTGTVVYTETQTPTTNANGLVSIEIGGGIGFSTINWATDNYYIETKTAVVAPLTTYTITGVSQLLSVPYALNAKTAENSFSGNYNDLTNKPTLFDGNYNSLSNKPTLFDGTWTSLTGKPTFAAVATSGSYNDLTNKPTIPPAADGSETKVTAGTKITVTGTGTTGSPYIINATAHYIGESYGGGIVFYVYDNGQHGLIAATSDQSLSMRSYAGTSTNTMTYADGVNAGKANTAIIIANQGYGDAATYAARVCNEYSVTVSSVTYADWYLPSKYELNLLYLQKVVVGGFANSTYWSSTEYSNDYAWYENFASGNQIYGSKSNTLYVRAIRAF